MTSTRVAQRLGRPAGALAVCSTATLAALTLLDTVPGQRLVGAAVAVTLVWSCAPLALVLLTPRRAPADADDESEEHSAEQTDPTTGFTTFVRLGDEPPAIARSSVALARRMGPTVIVTRAGEIPEELHLEADAVHTADTIEQAVLEAAASVDTDAVLIVSARAVPQAAACARAAQLLDDRTGWVVGTSRPFNDDRYASDRREVVGAALRRYAVRAGVDLWENDATLIRSELLAEHPLEVGRPWGAWLRERRAEGLRGAEVDDALSLRAAPVAAGSYWPDALARHRAVAADAGSAVRQGGARARVVAALLVARELYAYPLAVWLMVPVLMSEGFAFRVDPWVLSVLLGAAAVLRWWSLRALLHVETLPRADLSAAVYHAPGSLAALVPALRGHLGTGRRRTTPTRPLVWAALVLTVVAAYGLLRHEPGQSPSRVAVAVSLAMLLALWAFTVRSLVERNWSRSSYRVPMTLEASVAGVTATTVDGSPGGLAVRGRFPAGAFGAGTEVDVEVHLDDDVLFSSPAVVAARRRSRGRDLLGLELHPGPDALDDWTAQLLRAAEAPGGGHLRSVSHERTTGGDRAGEVMDRSVLGAVVVISVAVVVALGLVLLGFRPFVVRSGSMVPTYHVGDIVIVEQIPADQLRPGDVASLEYYPDFGESMTHRVRSIRQVDGAVQVETRGDANDRSEVWAVAPDALVGRVVASVPAIGAPATLVRTNRGPLLVGLALLMLAVGAVLWGHRLRTPARTRAPSPADDQASVSDQDRVHPTS